MAQQQSDLYTALEDKLELAEKALSYFNHNVELTMEMWIEASQQNEALLAKRADNSAKIATLIQQLRDELESDEERELLDAASPRLSLMTDYGDLLNQITDGQNPADPEAATTSLMLPLLLDNASWKAYVELLRARSKAAALRDKNSEAMARRTRELVRQNQVLKSIVAERKRLEERLSQLASIIECANDAIAIYTLGGTIVSWNKGAETVYGYLSNEVLGRSRYILIAPEQPDEIPKLLERVKREERIEPCQAMHVRKGGQRMRVSISLSPVKDLAGNVVGFAAITRCLSNRKDEPQSPSAGPRPTEQPI